MLQMKGGHEIGYVEIRVHRKNHGQEQIQNVISLNDVLQQIHIFLHSDTRNPIQINKFSKSCLSIRTNYNEIYHPLSYFNLMQLDR